MLTTSDSWSIASGFPAHTYQTWHMLVYQTDLPRQQVQGAAGRYARSLGLLEVVFGSDAWLSLRLSAARQLSK